MSNKAAKQRKKIPKSVEAQVLTECRRRCCLCHYLENKTASLLQGQIAHIDHDRTNHNSNNLAYLCMPHHDTYDSTTRQSKGITLEELVFAKEGLLKLLRDDRVSGRELVSLTLVVDNRFSQLSEEAREQLLKSMLPPLVQASKVGIPTSPDGKTRYTVELAAEAAERLCKQFNANTLSPELVDVALTRTTPIRIVFDDNITTECMSKQQAIEAVQSYDQVTFFLEKRIVTTWPASCVIFTKRHANGHEPYTTIVVAVNKNGATSITTAVKAYHETVGNLDGANPLQCLEAFLKVFGVPFALPEKPQGLYVLGESLTLPFLPTGPTDAMSYLKRFFQCPRGTDWGMIGAFGHPSPSTLFIGIMYGFQRGRYLSSIRNK